MRKSVEGLLATATENEENVEDDEDDGKGVSGASNTLMLAPPAPSDKHRQTRPVAARLDLSIIHLFSDQTLPPPSARHEASTFTSTCSLQHTSRACKQRPATWSDLPGLQRWPWQLPPHWPYNCAIELTSRSSKIQQLFIADQYDNWSILLYHHVRIYKAVLHKYIQDYTHLWWPIIKQAV